MFVCFYVCLSISMNPTGSEMARPILTKFDKEGPLALGAGLGILLEHLYLTKPLKNVR